MAQTNQLGVQVTADIADFQKKFDDMKGQLAGLGQSTQKAGEAAADGLAGMQKEIGGIGAILNSAVFIKAGQSITEMVTAPLIGLGKQAVLLADDLRKSEIAFGVMLGSGEKARAMLRDLQQFANTTPYEFPDLVRAAQKMKAFGIEAEMIIPTMRTVGDAVSGLGGGTEMFDRIIRAMGQMDAKGKVSAGEMNQFAEAGINAWQAVADALGITVAEAMERARKGQIDSATALTAIQADMVQKFGGMMAEQSKTIQGTLANLNDTLGFIMTDIGQQLIETLNLGAVLGSIQEFAQGFLGWFRALDGGTKKTIIALTGAFALGGPILLAVGLFMAAMAVVTSPMLVAGAIITGIVAGGALLIAHWGTVKNTATAIWQAITGTIQGWGKATNDTINGAIKAVVTAFTSLKTQSIQLVADMVTGIGHWLGGKLTAVFAQVKAPIEAVKSYFAGLYDAVVGHSSIPDMIKGIKANIDQLPAKMVTPTKRAITEVENAFRELQRNSGATVEQNIQEIGDHMRNLDVSMTAPARNAVVNTARVLEGGALTWTSTISQFASTANQSWGSISQTFASNLAQMTDGAVSWGEGIKQVGLQLMTNMITLSIGLATQWAIGEVMRTTATVAGESARVATNVTANAAIVASNGAAAATSIGIWGGATAAIMGFFAAVGAGFAAITGALVGAVVAVGTFIMGVLSAIASALSATIFGIPFAGAILVGIGLIAAALALTDNLPAFADGGAVFGPTLALVGENASRGNPEYIGHANQLGLHGGGRAQEIRIYLDRAEIGRAVAFGMPSVVKVYTGVHA